jgi:hypothetical protein
MVLYGFHNLQDITAARVTGQNVEAVNDAINLAVATYNEEQNRLMAALVDRVTQPSERYAQISDATLQPLDENGRALPIKPSGFYDVAYPIRMAGSAWGANYITRVKMTVGDAERATAQMIRADRNWMRRQMLAAIFSNGTWTFADPVYGDLTIQPLASNDSVQFSNVAGSQATDNHLYAQAGAISDAANPFPTLFADLMEHPQNTGQAVAVIPTALKASVQGLATFHPVADPNIEAGNASDRLVGNLGIAMPGTLIGYEESGTWIVEWDKLPATHGFMFATGGDRPLGMREHPEPELQGYNRVADRDDHPFYESQWLRMAGFGARNRVGAIAFRIGNGTYAVPTGYAQPA